MSNSLKWRAALVLAVGLLGGCGPSYTYRYSPPPSMAGMNCINSCSMERNHCKQMARLQENSDHALYQANYRNYQLCQAGKSKKEARKSCYYPSYPFNSGSSYSCGSDYDSCYQSCGGTIQRILNKD
ncbi:hypothetical protein ACIOVF_24995 [Pseudomonas sp. NPDC087612]|uniref:Lipoprotein n=1 Tax=Pseudomonas vranovensis TaxID=321661 RepID=A0A423DUY3_9PSED|nr:MULTISPECIES: hypothetical protein [Pseudomonas]QVM97080.1 hypothetical protein JYG36_02445 [Pseudomonas sp. SORT22]ROL75974.1 hypothetical protein BHU25_07160 [Pseudomonas vranovensis]UVL56051.1 hypothetical protein LOY22_25050 [Pseudomonas sp. B21-035]UVL61354.1 hypothetical protein LOY54_25695 [Pseudomonas sp. B21-032]UVM55664.1 hypothetical protein LOY37_25625 [Pseudomonas sp. B21-012]